MKVLQFNMTRVSMTVLLAAALLLAACAPAATPISAPTTAPAAVAPTVIPATAGPAAVATPAPAPKLISALDFHNAMRKLWEDHITWTRMYIVSAAANLPDKDQTAQRLLQNQTDIGNAIKPFYGEQAGNQLTALLRDHILGAADLIAAAQSGDQAKVQAASAKWYANADDIATFLSKANPKAWPLA